MIEQNWEQIGNAVIKHRLLSLKFDGKSKKLAEFKLQELPLLECMNLYHNERYMNTRTMTLNCLKTHASIN